MNLNNLRKEYIQKSLTFESLKQNPIEQFEIWLNEAIAGEVLEPTAFCLATASTEGFPSSRMVLLKEFSKEGFIFYTNLESRKGKELLGNPHACCTWWWKELERQVIVEGTVSSVSKEQAADYFKKRPRGSQLGAWSSLQGTRVPSREFLEKRYDQFSVQYANKEIPLPPFWGGFCIKPYRVEFWQGRRDRMHDRFEYIYQTKDWAIFRLSP